MVVDGRTELASPDMELARLLLRGGKPVFLAVNKMDTEAIQSQAENFRQLGFRNVLPISAEHNSGIGDLLDAVFAVLPEAAELDEPAVMLTEEDEAEEDANGPDYSIDPVAKRIVIDPRHYEGEATKTVMPPLPLGRMGRRLQEIVEMTPQTRPLDLYAALAEVAR